MAGVSAKVILLLAVATVIGGCDPIRRQQVMAGLFLEYPALPSPEDYCRAAEENARKKAAAPQKGPAEAQEHSIHKPYGEKHCNDCHQAEKTLVAGGLVKPKDQLCFTCHPTILKPPARAHGPAAQGECLECHLPHEANQGSLLSSGKNALCERCHSEKRLAGGMHDKIKAQGLVCTDCHDPHSGTVHFYLR